MLTVSCCRRANSSAAPKNSTQRSIMRPPIMPTWGLCRILCTDQCVLRGAGERSRHNQSPSRKAINSSPGR
jgi:hypothetical protein